MKNVACSTREELLDVHSRSWDLWFWSNAPAVVRIGGQLVKDFERYCATADPNFKITPAEVAEWGLRLVNGDLAGYYASLIMKHIKFISSIGPWKRRFGDDDLYAAFAWLVFMYRVVDETPTEIVFVWDSPL